MVDLNKNGIDDSLESSGTNPYAAPSVGGGKSLMLTAIGNIRKIIKIDGKAYNPSKNDFVYQRVNIDTQVLAFDDVKKQRSYTNLW